MKIVKTNQIREIRSDHKNDQYFGSYLQIVGSHLCLFSNGKGALITFDSKSEIKELIKGIVAHEKGYRSFTIGSLKVKWTNRGEPYLTSPPHE